ncbi:MAG: hypothetical protein NVS3B5_09770 [Sphingomicrobium sp.]
MPGMQQDVLDDADWAEAHRREIVVRPLAAKPHVSANDIAIGIATLKIERTRLLQLIREYRADPQARTLLTRKPGRARGERRMDAPCEALVEHSIEHCYLTCEKPSVQAVLRHLAHECKRLGMAVPSRKVIQARIDARPARQVLAAREGQKAAADKYRPIRGTLEANYALQLVQSDHTLVDVVIVDDLYRMPIGRPWLTLMIDIASRSVPGFHLTLLHPSAVSVGMAMRHAVLPKGPWLAENGLDAPWTNEGLMDQLHLDNAKEHHSNALKRGCHVHLIELQYRPCKRPHFGGHIERLIGTMMGAVHLLPGTTFSNVVQRGEYDSEGKACMTLAELEIWLAAQIIGPYHADTHLGIGVPPALAWADAVEARPAQKIQRLQDNVWPKPC